MFYFLWAICWLPDFTYRLEISFTFPFCTDAGVGFFGGINDFVSVVIIKRKD